MTSTVPLVQTRRPGALAFLNDSVKQFAFDVDEWKTKEHESYNINPKRRRRRKKRDEELGIISSSNSASESMPLSNILGKKSVIVLFVFDVRQQHSYAVRRNLVNLWRHFGHLCNQLHCVALSSSSSSSGNDDDDDATQAFLRSTGFALATMKNPSLRGIVLGVTQTPAVVLIEASSGRKMIGAGSHEELALEWNEGDAVIQKWSRGQSGLSTTQNIMAAALFPTCEIL